MKRDVIFEQSETRTALTSHHIVHSSQIFRITQTLHHQDLNLVKCILSPILMDYLFEVVSMRYYHLAEFLLELHSVKFR